MKVKLRILHGTLQDTHGQRAVQEVKVRGPQFVIGNAADCSLCCRSDSVLPHHCEVLLEPGRALIRKLSDRADTFINGQRMEREQVLQAGDHLRLGRLEFEVLIEDASPAAPPPVESESPTTPPAGEPEPERDPAAEEMSDLLVQADERDRTIRQQHPELRVLHVETAHEETAKTEPQEAATADEAGPVKKKKKKPGKLPVRPPKNEITGEDSTSAAQEALRKLFSR
ncbi:MAG: FHA domain-containing protein [Candidatus Anammoximicrobium sp.]|nr:FHA domain-containing protein [Candidatus Anammoximicrobium sp.]